MPAFYTSRAEEDLHEIWMYIARQSVDAADRVVTSLTQECETLNRSPGIGEACEQYARGLRRFTVGNYVVFYLASAPDIQVIRILHGARDIENLF